MFHGYRWVGFISVTAATLLAGGGVAANQIIREPVSGSKPPAASSFLMTVADYGSGFAALPKWQQRLLRVRYGTTRLGRSVPAGGEQLFDPQAAALPHAYATPLVLRPASPSNSDITATQAATVAVDGYGGAVTDTVFGDATLVTQLPPAGQATTPGAVVNSPVWVVTITSASPISPISCGPIGSSCPSATFTSWIVLVNAVSGQEVLAFDQ